MTGPLIALRRARPPLERTAVHESAHAVVGEALGCAVDFVSITPAPASRGRCVFETRGDGPEWAAAWLAGPLATKLLQEERLRAPTIEPWPTWLARAKPVEASEPPPGVADLLLDDNDGANAAVRSPEERDWAATMALTVLAANWSTVVAVAEALGRAGELEGAEVRALIEDATDVRGN